MVRKAQKRSEDKKKSGFFSGNPKLIHRFAILFWTTAVFMILLIGGQTYSTSHLQKIADQNYGLWQAAIYDCSETEQRSIQENPLLETVGTQNITGSVIQIDENEPDPEKQEKPIGAIGYADAAFYTLADLQFKLGRLPETENEIAVEAAALDTLGISYTPGQTVTLPVRTNAETTEVRTFVLSGILENYSSYWNTGNGELIRYFILAPNGADSGDERRVQATHVFMKAYKTYEGVFQEIEQEMEDSLLIENTNRQISRDPFASENRLVTVLLLLSLLLCGLLVFEFLLFWIYQHSQEIRLIRILGIRRHILCRDLFSLLVRAACWPILAVLFFSLWMRISFWLGLLLAGTALLLLASVTLAVSLFVWHIEPLPNRQIKRHRKNWPAAAGKKADRPVITPGLVASRLSASLYKNRLIFTVTVCLMEIVCLFSGFQVFWSISSLHAVDLQADYRLESRDIPSLRYTRTANIDGISISQDYLYANKKEVPEDIVDKLAENTNLKVLQAAGVNRDNFIWWEDQENSLLYRTRPLLENQTGGKEPDLSDGNPGMLEPDSDGVWRFYGSVVQIDQPEMIEQLQKTEIEGEVDWERWQRGEQAIVYVPPMIESIPGVLSASWTGKTDPTLETGDHLLITSPNGESSEIPVGGIIRDPGWKFEYAPLYGILLGGSDITSIHLKLISEKNQIPTEVMLSQLASDNDLIFSNSASWHLRVSTQFKIRAAAILFFCIIACFTGLMILEINFQRLTFSLHGFEEICQKIGVLPSVSSQITKRYILNLSTGTLILSAVVFIAAGMVLIPTIPNPSFPVTQILWCLISGIVFSLLFGGISVYRFRVILHHTGKNRKNRN